VLRSSTTKKRNVRQTRILAYYGTFSRPFIAEFKLPQYFSKQHPQSSAPLIVAQRHPPLRSELLTIFDSILSYKNNMPAGRIRVIRICGNRMTKMKGIRESINDLVASYMMYRFTLVLLFAELTSHKLQIRMHKLLSLNATISKINWNL